MLQKLWYITIERLKEVEKPCSDPSRKPGRPCEIVVEPLLRNSISQGRLQFGVRLRENQSESDCNSDYFFRSIIILQIELIVTSLENFFVKSTGLFFTLLKNKRIIR